MKFKITRTSAWREEKPCEEAQEVELEYIDFRSVSREEMVKNHGERFNDYINKTLRNGANGCYKVKGKEKAFTIEINSIDELIKFMDKYGSIVITPNEDIELPEIEIYDTWRE